MTRKLVYTRLYTNGLKDRTEQFEFQLEPWHKVQSFRDGRLITVKVVTGRLFYTTVAEITNVLEWSIQDAS